MMQVEVDSFMVLVLPAIGCSLYRVLSLDSEHRLKKLPQALHVHELR
jgi:hypothetical protein